MIRRAVPGEAPALAALVRAAYAHYVPRVGREPAPMSADYEALVAAGRVWVAEGEGGAVEGLLVLEPESDHLLIENVAVAPDAQGRRVGGALLAHAEAEARRGGLPELRLFTHVTMTENRAWYTRHGYRELCGGTLDGFRRVWLAKPTPPA